MRCGVHKAEEPIRSEKIGAKRGDAYSTRTRRDSLVRCILITCICPDSPIILATRSACRASSAPYRIHRLHSLNQTLSHPAAHLQFISALDNFRSTIFYRSLTWAESSALPQRLSQKMAPKQATLGYVKSGQQTLGCMPPSECEKSTLLICIP